MSGKEIKNIDELAVALTIDEVADILKVSKTSAYRLVNEGGLRSIKVGKQIRVSRKDLKAFIEAS